MSMITLKDVAEKAGVSVSLVSKVINNKMGNSTVTKEKAQKIRDIASEMGYVPNLSARSLRLGRTDTITVLMPYSKNTEISSYYDFMVGILDASGKTSFNISCVFYSQDSSDGNELQCLRNIAELPVAGLIYIPSFRAVTDTDFQDTLKQILNNGTPVLSCIIQYNTVKGINYSVVDDTQCGRTVAKHCIEKGYKDFVFINSGAWYRNEGFSKTMREAGIELDGKVIENRESFERKAGYDVYMEFIKDRKRLPEAIIATCDLHAMGIIDAMEECGVSTDEIEVIGFDGLRSLKILRRKYTTVVQPFFDMGYNAVMDMVNRIENGEMKNKAYDSFIKEFGND